MFQKILIANRGEIACRVMDTCDQLGISTVAVYSDVDVDARHACRAGQAVRIGPAPVAKSYLLGDAIIQAALDTGAEAIHPGYGFLSENPDFVEAVEGAGLVFIGPSANAIRSMGLKDAAKDLMERAGVPVVPGYHGKDQDPTFLAIQAAQIGYPVLIKAVAGGGGKGMRLVEAPDDFAEHLASAQSEARNAFGNADVLIEKYINQPRHIEVQVFGDGTNAVHLFERDCSLQRRHQKVIEEAPAPGMTGEMRDAMGQAAVCAAEAIGYAGAGTVEFIVDGSDGLHPDKFWFMEMNTRLQVEHPVTEAITGVDLVAWQLHVAAGGSLPADQSDLHINGHSIEARLYAEDVPAGFLPSTGTVSHLKFSDHARIDSGIEQGSEISPWYDPMIAKLTVHGVDRGDALRKLSRALGATQVAGTVTNLNFLSALAGQPDFVAGRVDTGLIARHLDTLSDDGAPSDAEIAVAALAAAGLSPPFAPFAGFSIWGANSQSVTILSGDTAYTRRFQVLDSKTVQVGDLQLRWDGSGWRTHQGILSAVCIGPEINVFGTVTRNFMSPDPLVRGSGAAAGDEVLAPMPGLVRSVDVQSGDTVVQGQRLMVLEAMKMEHVLRAPRDGCLSSVAVELGEQVTGGQLLIALADQDD